MTIRLQATGIRHKIKGYYWDGMYNIYVTLCGQRCMFMVIGNMPEEPDKVDCNQCYMILSGE